MPSKMQMLYEQFRNMFPDLASRTERYSQLDMHTIKLYLRDGRRLVFRYRSEHLWTLSTYQTYSE